jgi:hypothetical protein
MVWPVQRLSTYRLALQIAVAFWLFWFVVIAATALSYAAVRAERLLRHAGGGAAERFSSGGGAAAAADAVAAERAELRPGVNGPELEPVRTATAWSRPVSAAELATVDTFTATRAELPGLLHSQPDTSESVEMARFRSVLLSLPRSPEVAMLLGMAGELADGPTTAAARVVARGREIDGDGSQGENGAEFGNVFLAPFYT